MEIMKYLDGKNNNMRFPDIFNLKIKAFGLDISDLALKLVQLDKKGKSLNIRCFNEIALPEGIIKRGVILQPEELVKKLKELVKKTRGLNAKYVVLSLPEERSFLQVISMPKMTEEETKNAVRYEAENYIPFSIDKIYLDSQTISYQEKTQEVLLAALPIATVDPYLEVLNQAGLEPLVLETESQAIARSLMKGCKCVSPCLIMDIGAIRTTLIIISGNAPRFSASIPLSANLFTGAIAKTLKIDMKKAEQLKRTCGLKNQNQKEKEVFDALIPILTDLMEQTKKHIEYYHDYAVSKNFSEKDITIKRIIVCGGGGNLLLIDKFLQKDFGLPVEIGNPLINIDFHKDLIPKDQLLRFAVAMGLAIRGLKEND